MQAELRSEDTDNPSLFRIKSISEKMLPGKEGEQQLWQVLSVDLISGKRCISSIANEEIMLCKRPLDELAELKKQLKELLDGTRQEVLFEPSEPSIEINLVRSRRNGIRVEFWLDAGNGTTGIYTWDACGVRFMTDDENLKQFIAEL